MQSKNRLIAPCQKAGRWFLLSSFAAVLYLPVYSQKKFVFEQPKMGSPFTITIFTSDSLEASSVAANAFLLVDSLNNILSDYIDSSEINRLSARSGSGAWMPLSPTLFDVLSRAQAASHISAGAFDMTVGPLVQLWRTARKKHALPRKKEVKKLRRLTGYHLLRIDSSSRSARGEKKGMKLDAGGIGKGYIAQQVLTFLQQQKLPQSMVAAGGQMVCGAAPHPQKGWLIGISVPGNGGELMPQLLSIANQSVSTSGDWYQFVEINGKRYSHIVNPATGMGLTTQKTVTVIADDGATADWLSTACSVLTTHKCLRLVEKIPGAAVLITEKTKGAIEKESSALFENHFF